MKPRLATRQLRYRRIWRRASHRTRCALSNLEAVLGYTTVLCRTPSGHPYGLPVVHHGE